MLSFKNGNAAKLSTLPTSGLIEHIIDGRNSLADLKACNGLFKLDVS